jgi:hypothetical protein
MTYSAQTLIRVIKSRRIRWAGHVAWMGNSYGAYRVLVGKYKEQRPLETHRRRREDSKLEGISKSGIGIWTGLIWLSIRTGSGFLSVW